MNQRILTHNLALKTKRIEHNLREMKVQLDGLKNSFQNMRATQQRFDSTLRITENISITSITKRELQHAMDALEKGVMDMIHNNKS